jgi:large subunit ribosomal protein L11
MEFCKAFNAATQNEEPGTPIPVVITVYADRSFTFVTKLPPVSHYLKKAVGLSKGSSNPGKDAPVGKISMGQIREIAEKKMKDLNAHTVEAASAMIRGSALAMGLEVVE